MGVFLYLTLQSISDIKTMQVYALPNNIVLSILTVLYFTDCILFQQFPDITSLWITAGIIFLFLCKMYGSGDSKAMISILLATRYLKRDGIHPDAAIFALGMIFASVLFILFHYIKRFLSKKKNTRAAFFPFLTAGFLSIVLLGRLAVE